MRIDFATLAFGYRVESGGNTPNWATALGQGKEYKILDDGEIEELLKGVTHKSVPLSCIESKIGKGGKTIKGNAEDSPIVLGACFDNVYINDELIEGAKYIILITKDTSKSHAGRLRFKYGPSNAYIDEDNTYSNEGFWVIAKQKLGLNEKACFFVYDISVENQNDLILRTIIVNKDERETYKNSQELHQKWNELIEADEKINEKETIGGTVYDDYEELTPEWFDKKGQDYLYLDDEAEEFVSKFKEKFSPEKLEELEGEDLLNTIFLNKNNKTNLCWTLEFDKDCKRIFGSISAGTAYKYGLHYSKKNDAWATGNGRSPEFLNQEEAIEMGTQIRDYLVAGAKLIDGFGEISSLEDYEKLYDELTNVTNGYSDRVWFMKYYTILNPHVFPDIYSYTAQSVVLEKLNLPIGDNNIVRMGQIQGFINQCSISNIVFGKVFWTYCSGTSDEDKVDEEEIVDMKYCIEIERKPRKNKLHPLNFIIYGAPGTGKTYSTAEYALAILENREADLSKKTDDERKEIVKKYKEYVKDNRIVFTTFHQNYGYEEFIQGLRPDKDSDNMSFEIVDGVFKRISDIALNDTNDNNNYVIIIDEINRANISKVFGELITLIEDDKRWGEINETSVALQSGDIFAVPNNLYIVGTMNSADKSISLIDAALRRRFSFIEQTPDSNLVENESLREVMDSINKKLVKDLDSTDLLVGHSYFMNKDESDLIDILNNNIIPLVYEYYYDDRKKVIGLLKHIIEDNNLELEIDDDMVGRLKVKTKE